MNIFNDLTAIGEQFKVCTSLILLELTLFRVIITYGDHEKLVPGFHALWSLSIFTALPDFAIVSAKRLFHLRSSSLRSHTIVSGTATELLNDASNLEQRLIEPQLALINYAEHTRQTPWVIILG